MRFSEVEKAHGGDHRAPLAVCELEPRMFAHTWPRRPELPVKVGLRLLSDTDELNARSQAEEYIVKFEHDDIENRLDCYNDTLMAGLVARALCDEKDARKSCGMFPIQDHKLLQQALGSQTLRYLFEELERVKIAYGIAHTEATDEEIERLCEYLKDGSLQRMEKASERLVRRFARFMLEELAEYD